MHPTLPVALHGMSYPKREVTDNLVPSYPAAIAGRFNIGLLHTNAGGNSLHAAYAPCPVEELVAKGYGYWALGHVHEFVVLNERPHVVYPGNTQGRHAREIGPKGCVLVEVDVHSSGGEVLAVDFRETDLVRWFRETVELQPDDDEDALLDATRTRLREIISAANGRLAAVRLEFTGRCKVHGQLAKDSTRQQLVANLRALASDLGDDVWIEKIKFHTQSPLDLDALRERHDLIGQLLRDIGVLTIDPHSLLALPETKDLATKLAAELPQDIDSEESFNFEDPIRQVAWLRDAEAILLSHLVPESGGQT